MKTIIAVIVAYCALFVIGYYIGETNKNNPIEVRCAK